MPHVQEFVLELLEFVLVGGGSRARCGIRLAIRAAWEVDLSLRYARVPSPGSAKFGGSVTILIGGFHATPVEPNGVPAPLGRLRLEEGGERSEGSQ